MVGKLGASRFFKPHFIIGGTIIYIGATYFSYTYFKSKKSALDEEKSSSTPLQLFQDNSGVFEKIAANYDSKIGKDEFFMGLLSKRKKLIHLAKVIRIRFSDGCLTL